MNSEIVAEAFYDEDYEELEKITGLKVKSQNEFENKFIKLQKKIKELNEEDKNINIIMDKEDFINRMNETDLIFDGLGLREFTQEHYQNLLSFEENKENFLQWLIKPEPCIHEKLRKILVDYGNEEFGDAIIDEICKVFKQPTTTEISLPVDVEDWSDEALITHYGLITRELQNRGYNNAETKLLNKKED